MPTILTGKQLASDILDAVAMLSLSGPARSPILGIIGNAAEYKDTPYYKGIAKDAKYCGIRLLDLCIWEQLEDYSEKCEHPYFGSIVLSHESVYLDRQPKFNNLDGGYFMPCTCEAVLELLRYYNVNLIGKHVCILGRSIRVGGPLSHWLTEKDATVTICHSKTENFMKFVEDADIVISCTGDPSLFAECDGPIKCKKNALVIDIGGEFVGREVQCAAMIPFIGGVGPVTRAVLMRHALQWYFPREVEDYDS